MTNKVVRSLRVLLPNQTEERKSSMRKSTGNTGLTLAKFDGKSAQNQATYIYDHIVTPWARVGKDTTGQTITGTVPALTDLLKFCISIGTTNEFEIDATGKPKGPSVAGLLLEGINLHLNRIARTRAVNTPEAARDKAIQLIMSKTGMVHAEAAKFLKAA